jgi:hypothetical protein
MFVKVQPHPVLDARKRTAAALTIALAYRNVAAPSLMAFCNSREGD